MVLIQTESPYYQPDPKAPHPFEVPTMTNDPTFEDATVRKPGLYALWVRLASSFMVPGCTAGSATTAKPASTRKAVRNVYSTRQTRRTYGCSICLPKVSFCLRLQSRATHEGAKLIILFAPGVVEVARGSNISITPFSRRILLAQLTLQLPAAFRPFSQLTTIKSMRHDKVESCLKANSLQWLYD